MKLFPYAHATHPQWRMAAALVLAQLRAQMALPDHASTPGLAMLYITDHYAADAQAILDHLSAELPEVNDWVGTVGVGICANNAEYFDEPALAVMLCDLSPDQYRVFSGVAPLSAAQGAGGFTAQTALLHADGATPDVAELIADQAAEDETEHRRRLCVWWVGIKPWGFHPVRPLQQGGACGKWSARCCRGFSWRAQRCGLRP